MTNKKKYFTAVDLEMNQPSGRIIQIGACIGDINTGEIVDTFMKYVNPHEQITEYITNLTGIKQVHVDNAPDLDEAFEYLKAFHKSKDTYINPITWGGGDVPEIHKQLGQTIDGCEVFGRRWIDVKTVCFTWRLANDRKRQGGLAKSMSVMGMNFEGRKHDALADAINTFKIYHKLIGKLKEDV